MENKKIILFSILFILSIVFLNVVSAEVLVSDAGVEYDSDILKAFANKTFAKATLEKVDRTLETIDGQTWLRVMVDLKDKSRIKVTGTKEERRNLSRRVDVWFEPIVENILSTLSETDAKEIIPHSRDFGATISEQGFEKLVNNPAVKNIFWMKYEKISPTLIDNFSHQSMRSLIWMPIQIILILILWLITKKTKAGKFFKPTLWKIILFFVLMAILLIFLCSLNLKTGNCMFGPKCPPTYDFNQVIKIYPWFVIPAYLLSCLIVLIIKKIKKKKK